MYSARTLRFLRSVFAQPAFARDASSEAHPSMLRLKATFATATNFSMRRGFAALYTFCASALLAVLPAAAEPTPSTQAVSAAEKQFAEGLAKANGLDEAAILATLAKARYQQSVIDTISRPAESKPWKDYRPIFVNERRIDDGVTFYRENK